MTLTPETLSDHPNSIDSQTGHLMGEGAVNPHSVFDGLFDAYTATETSVEEHVADPVTESKPDSTTENQAEEAESKTKRGPSLRTSFTYNPNFREIVYQAKCRSSDPDLFFVDEKSPAEKLAKKICASCDIQVECLTEALVTGSDGIWGGTNETERRAMKRRMKRQNGLI